ncbi:MAG TPA: hypothetical protein PLT58_07060, partial [Atribacterota bacterium]|nr:hypothetical protein [Atribacterota bacterium]
MSLRACPKGKRGSHILYYPQYLTLYGIEVYLHISLKIVGNSECDRHVATLLAMTEKEKAPRDDK